MKNILVQEYTVVSKQRPTPWYMKDLLIPRWLLTLLLTLSIIVLTAFAVFDSIVLLKKETNGGLCRKNTDCRQDRGLMCTNYRCQCAYSHFWSTSYLMCEKRRSINRACTDHSICDSLANLLCQDVQLR